MKKTSIIIIIVILVLLAAGIYVLSKKSFNSGDSNLPIIGGQRDAHGCLGPAGYSWNESEKECVREWSHDEDRYQVTNFQTCVDAGYKLIKTDPARCETPSGKRFGEETQEEKYCEQDSDCACGTHIQTGECFIGNKNYVNTETQCPDFCTGIAGNFEISCVNNECRHVPA
jgi:hypothetical protein